MPSLTSADKGKTHSILACVSASGQVIVLFMVYLRKRPVPEKLREGAYPNMVFHVSDNGWMTKELFFEWFKLFDSPFETSVIGVTAHTSLLR